MGFIVPAIKAVAAVVAKSAVAKAVVKIAAAAIISKVATKAISKLIAKRADIGGASGTDAGARVQLPPAAENKLPIVYGTSWVGGPVIDAKISVDQKYMWYVIALSEKPDGQTITFDTTDGIYYGSKKVQFGSNGVVNALITNTTPAQVDTKMAGKIYIWLFQNGAINPGVNTGLTAYQIMSDASTGGGIPDGWNTSIYTNAGQSVQLNNMAFAIVRLEYNADAGTTSLDTLQVKLTNNMGGDNGCKPGIALLDYLTNERYGCAIPLALIDTASLTSLDAYSDEYVVYVPPSGGAAQNRRYRVNGPLDTGNDCLTNLQILADSCDSWLQYTETSGKWRIVPNKPYTGTLTNLFNVNATNQESCNVIGGIQINPIDLNDTYNQVEVAYPNTNVRDQTDYQIVDLTDPSTAWFSSYNQVLSPNEAINRLNISLPLVNNAVQAKYLAVRRLLQSREDLVITCQTDYSGIQVDAGDVVRVNHEVYGWTNKLFRVSTVSEVQDEQGNLSALIEAFEYNDAIYADNAIQDFVPTDITGLSDPNVLSQPGTPVLVNLSDQDSLITGFSATSYVPIEGTVIYMDFNYGTTSNVQTHRLYRTVQAAQGEPFTNSDSNANVYNNITITINDIPSGNYYWSATARSNNAGRSSDASQLFVWRGANINPYNPGTGNGGVSGNQIQQGAVTNYNIANLTIIGNNISGNTIGFDKIGTGTSLEQIFGTLEAGFPGNLIDFGSGTFNYGVVTTGTYIGGDPGYLDGNDPGVNYIFPWYQNTSSTGNGYVANSTGPFAPFNAGTISGNTGTDGWYIIGLLNYGTDRVADDTEGSSVSGDLTLVANVDTTVQICTFATFGNSPNTMQMVTGAMTSVNLIANCPQRPIVGTTSYSSVASDFTAGGIAMRNITSGSRVYVVDMEMQVTKSKFAD